MTTSANPERQQTIDYLERAYANNRNWYTTTETKAQLILGANGIFATILLTSLLGKLTDAPSVLNKFGTETWTLFSLGLAAIATSVTCAALSMISQHGEDPPTN